MQVAFTSGAYVRIESVDCSGHPVNFLGMEAQDAKAGAVILGLDWSRVLDHLVSVGEDCRCVKLAHSVQSGCTNCHDNNLKMDV